MRYADRVNWVTGEGTDAWDIHYQAQKDMEHDPDVIVLSVGDPDFATPGPIVDAAISALRDGDTHYTPVIGRLDLRTAIADQLRKQGVADVDEGNVAVLAGAQNALFTTSLCLFSAGDEVITFDPMYVTYEAFIRVSGASLCRIPCSAESGFRPNIEALEQAITPNTRAIAFSNPNNPTGVVMNREELQAIAELAKRNDLWVIADEVYAGLTFEHQHTSIASMPDMAERTVTVSSLSKSHAMTGWRIGWMIGPPTLIKHAENITLCMLYGLPGFIQEAGLSALRDFASESETMRDLYRHRRDILIDRLDGQKGLKLVVPEAGMFALVDIRSTGLDAREFASRLYRQEKVSVLDGAAFGAISSGFVRLSFTNDDITLMESCRRILRFVAGISR